jgi:hypothetical protein
MNTANELMAIVDDLAGFWTDRVLESLRLAGTRNVTIDMELETWRTLKKALYSQFGRQPKVRAAFNRPSRSKFTPPLQLSAAGG